MERSGTGSGGSPPARFLIRMPRVVISDTSPLHYLILIGHAELLSALYTEVLVPEAVAWELQRDSHDAILRVSRCRCQAREDVGAAEGQHGDDFNLHLVPLGALRWAGPTIYIDR